jgi:hypothetical protein
MKQSSKVSAAHNVTTHKNVHIIWTFLISAIQQSQAHRIIYEMQLEVILFKTAMG